MSCCSTGLNFMLSKCVKLKKIHVLEIQNIEIQYSANEFL